MNAWSCIADDVKLGANVRLSRFINLYGCEISDETTGMWWTAGTAFKTSSGGTEQPPHWSLHLN